MAGESARHYEDFWGDILGFIRRRVAAGERDPLPIVNQIEARGKLRRHRSDRASGALPSRVGEFLNTGHKALSYGREIMVPPGTFETEIIFHDALQHLIEADTDVIVEFGAGYGRNLFWLESILRHERPEMHYIACELTGAGRDCARELAALRPEMKLEIVPFDFRNPDYGFLSAHASVLGFSLAAIEQVTFLPETFFSGLLAHGGKVVVAHYEPVGWQNDATLRRFARNVIETCGEGLSERDCFEALKQQRTNGSSQPPVSDDALLAPALALSRGWNRNLVSSLSTLQSSGAVEILFFKPNIWGGVRCPLSLIGWRAPNR
jgi:hypothetical protein